VAKEAMTMVESQLLSALRRLYWIVDAGERGYATAAANASRREIRLLFKSYAQQRAKFKAEILEEIRRLGGDCSERLSLLGIIHRGRVAIFAAMTIEDERRERVILREAAVGERFAEQTYRRTLQSERGPAADLPAETRRLVERQFEEVQKVIEEIHLLLGRGGKSLVVQLFQTEEEAHQGIQALQQSGLPIERIGSIGIDREMEQYRGKGTTVLETIISGAVGGMVWGSLIGVLAGIGAAQTSIPDLLGTSTFLGTLVLVALVTFVLAAGVGGLIGLVIGAGIAEDDTYEYRQSVLPGRCLVKAVVDTTRAADAARILDQVKNHTWEPTGPESRAAGLPV
jgi:uncharacterized protein (TIGR02284 family)